MQTRTMITRLPANITVAALVLAAPLLVPISALAQAAECPGGGETYYANIVALDQPVLFNRLGASNVNGMVFALERDVINKTSGLTLNNGGVKDAGNVQLRPDKRPRPLVLRIPADSCLSITLTNLLNATPNPNNIAPPAFNVFIDEQVAERHVSFHVAGLQYVNGPDVDDSAYVGANDDSTVDVGANATYLLYAAREGVHQVRGVAATLGADANQGNAANLLFGQVIVEPRFAKIYRSTVTEEEMRLATMAHTATGHPVINYEALYPTNPLTATIWDDEGKGGLPVLNMICTAAATNCIENEIIHSAIDAVIAGPGPDSEWDTDDDDGTFPISTYPLEKVGKRNPTLPNRLEPFRDFASMFHDEPSAAQAFPGFFKTDNVFRYVLAGVKDGFMINYGSGGIGSEILANRLRVGPMHDCLTCAFEEFFLTSFAVGDPAQLVDVPANAGLELLEPGQTPPDGTVGPKASFVPYPDDTANVHHSYIGDFAKFRNTHVGKEQHVFHLHNHQWLYNPNDDNSNYLDAQGIGPGSAYTYEINFGGSGNRPKSAGDAIFHCHFYPHFAQGMWYLWRHHDVLETGTPLEASGTVDSYHTALWALENGTPMLATNPVVAGARMRALPDGEVVVGAPIPAIIPLPGKPMPPLPGEVQLVPNPETTTASTLSAVDPGLAVSVGSLARVVDRETHPGYPFWIAGIEDTVGQRPPTPPLDMITAEQAQTLLESPDPLWDDLVPAQADGFDGGLPRASLRGYSAGGEALSVESRLDFSKVMQKAQGVFFPEEGTDVEHVAMAYHAMLEHPTCLPDGTCDGDALPGGGGSATINYILNGLKPAIGAPYHEPCMDDRHMRLGDGVTGHFFSSEPGTLGYMGSSPFNANDPRIYKGANIQFDAVLNKVGYHYPQQRIIALWEDSADIINKDKAPEPLVMRFNTFDCAVYHHANLVPEYYEMDDYQVRTPTDIIGQHIHLPKWDLTTADGAANGWNYEDGTLSPGAIRERIEALNAYHETVGDHLAGRGSDLTPPTTLTAQAHPFWAHEAELLGGAFPEIWNGARVTQQRWFFDPVINVNDEDRGLGIIFTHDHYGPSTHQQVGLYATVLTEPAGSEWRHNETGELLGDTAPGVNPAGRSDGGPTSWQAAILPPEEADSFREFYFEYTDFQHAYEAGVYIGADQDGVPLGEPVPGMESPLFVDNTGNPDFTGVAADAFRFAINPPFRLQIGAAGVPPDPAEPPLVIAGDTFPDLYVEAAGIAGTGCPERPCPQAIDVQDPGMFAVNYRNEPVGLRIYDPNRLDCPDGLPGCQAIAEVADTNGNGILDIDPERGDLSRALESRTDRAIAELNAQPAAGSMINGTIFPPGVNVSGVEDGDPFTPMIRVLAGDLVRVKQQAGGDEEEHQSTIHGLKWLQAGSGHGKAGNSGWRNAQSGGISEQFTLTAPVIEVALNGNDAQTDLLYSMDTSQDGYWSGMWGLMRVYSNNANDLYPLPNSAPGAEISNLDQFDGACPVDADVVAYDVTAILANDALPAPNTLPAPADSILIQDLHPTGHAGAAPDPTGGTLVYNSNIPIHDPTAVLYVHTSDLVPVDPTVNACFIRTTEGRGRNRIVTSTFDPTAMNCPVRLADNAPVEPLILRARAGDCIKVTLRNRLPDNEEDLMPDLATFNTLLGAVKRDRLRLEGATTFQTNLFATPSYVGLHPQLVAYDISDSDGTIVGRNGGGNVLASPNDEKVYTWYAGNLARVGREERVRGRTRVFYELEATPIELGTANLQPADKIKQGMKSLVGQLIIEPAGSEWAEDLQFDVLPENDGIPTFTAGGTRAQATVAAPGGDFREFSSIWTKGNYHFWANSEPVPHLNGEGVGLPEDSQEGSGMAINYRIEPLWARIGVEPNAAFGNATTVGSFGAQQQFDVFSNTAHGEPETPVYLANEDQPFRIRLSAPHGTNRGSTVQLHGYSWQRDPYVCDSTNDGIVGRCATSELGSTAIGHNVQGFYQSAQESIFPGTHFDLVLPNSNGEQAGDYLFRDNASFGNASGLWSIVRVQAVPE